MLAIAYTILREYQPEQVEDAPRRTGSNGNRDTRQPRREVIVIKLELTSTYYNTRNCSEEKYHPERSHKIGDSPACINGCNHTHNKKYYCNAAYTRHNNTGVGSILLRLSHSFSPSVSVVHHLSFHTVLFVI